MNRCGFACATAILVSCFARVAGAEEDRALPCRPTIACTADLVPAGDLEIELGYLRRALPDQVVHTVPLLVKLSLLDDLQLQVATNTAFLRDATRTRSIDDLSAGAKLRLFTQTEARPAVSFSLAFDGVDVPARHRVAYGPITTAYVTKDLGALHADFNVGAARWWLANDAATQGFVALALSTDLGHGFSPMIEGYAFSRASFVATKDAGVLAALAYSPRPFLTFDVGGDVALFPSTRRFSLFVGVTVIAARLWNPG